MLEKEFIPYEQALELKELGFDEPCFGYYNNKGDLTFNTNNNPVSKDWVWYGNELLPTDMVLAPTFSQLFRWFREKYDIQYWFHDGGYLGKVFIKITGFKHDKFYFSSSEPMEYEEAELACLNKLIEIVKNK